MNISVITQTEKYSNYSYSEELKYDDKSDKYGIVYVYSQKENNSLDLKQRNGTTELRVITIEEVLHLEGEFWTIHGTKGVLKTKKISNKKIDTFKEAKKINLNFQRSL